MNTRTRSTIFTPALALAVALFGASCGSDGSTTDAQRDGTSSTTGSDNTNGTGATTPNGSGSNTTTE